MKCTECGMELKDGFAVCEGCEESAECANQFTGVHEEFVRVIQGASSLYRFGSDRVNNADDYCRKHAAALVDFESPELHPDTCAKWRNAARKIAR